MNPEDFPVALEKNNIDDIAQILNSDFDPNHVYKLGYTPLHFAVAFNKPMVVKLLLEKGADVFALNDSQISPAKMILDPRKTGRDQIKIRGLILTKITEILTKIAERLGARLHNEEEITLDSTYGGSQRTLLSLAIVKDDLEVIALLVNSGLDINKADIDMKNTPLHLAVIGNHVDAAKILLDSPLIELDILNEDEETALDLAKRANKSELVKLIEDKAKALSSPKLKMKVLHEKTPSPPVERHDIHNLPKSLQTKQKRQKSSNQSRRGLSSAPLSTMGTFSNMGTSPYGSPIDIHDLPHDLPSEISDSKDSESSSSDAGPSSSNRP